MHIVHRWWSLTARTPKKRFIVKGRRHMPSPSLVNSPVLGEELSHFHWSAPLMAGSIFCKKNEKRPPPPQCSHYVQYCTMTKHRIRGCCISVFPFGLRLIFLFCFLGSEHQQYKSMVIYCDSVMFLWLKKKKWKISFFVRSFGFWKLHFINTVIKTNALHGNI